MHLTHYIPLNDARKTLLERRRTPQLRQQVEQWWMSQGWNIPDIPWETKPFHFNIDVFGENNWNVQIDNFLMAGLPRQVATARYEDLLFYLMAEHIGLVPTWLEYTGDTFYEGSPGKKSLLHLHRCSGRGRNGGWKLSKVRLANPNQWHRKPLNSIICDDGRKLVDVHSQMQFEAFQSWPRHIDMTDWLKRIGNAKQYYTAALSLFVCHGVMFEDYHGGESGTELKKLTEGIFEPAFNRIRDLFGVPPLIVRLPWREQLGFYPDEQGWDYSIIADLLAEVGVPMHL